MDLDATQSRESTPRQVRRFFSAIWMTGLIMPFAAGLLIWIVLLIQGEDVVSLARGAAMVLPFTLFFLIPYLMLAVGVRSILTRTYGVHPLSSGRWWYVAIGAYAALTLVSLFLLIGILPSFEGVAMIVVMWPLTFPVILLFEAGSVLAGSLLGWVVWRLFRKSTKLMN